MTLDLHWFADDPSDLDEEPKPASNLCCVICGEPSDAQECAACFDDEDRRWR
jgi:hypothetical protein